MSNNILNTIIEHKLVEVAARKKDMSIAELEAMPLFSAKTSSLKASIQEEGKTGIIAEFKRQSPSKGIINAIAGVEEVTKAYEQFGASGISVLTDQTFFGGSLTDLSIAVARTIPVLRKEFIVDEFQLIEAKAYGASVILLIGSAAMNFIYFNKYTTANNNLQQAQEKLSLADQQMTLACRQSGWR
mgnify:CR=1 FL=1